MLLYILLALYVTVLNCVRVYLQKLDQLSDDNNNNNNDNNNDNDNDNSYDNGNYNINLNISYAILWFDTFRIVYLLCGNTSGTNYEQGSRYPFLFWYWPYFLLNMGQPFDKSATSSISPWPTSVPQEGFHLRSRSRACHSFCFIFIYVMFYEKREKNHWLIRTAIVEELELLKHQG